MSDIRYTSVMLIDDNELDNFINKKLLENEHFTGTVTVHLSALNALEELKSMPENKLPDLIFLDIMMPHMDGFAFLDEFGKLDEKIKSHCKILMLSTSESFKDLNKANQNKHVYKFLNKPLSKPVLDAIRL